MALASGHQHHADHHRHLEAAERGEHLDRVGHVFVARLRALQHREQVREVGLFHVGAGNQQVGEVRARQTREQQRGALVRADADAGADDRALPTSESAISMPARIAACAWSSDIAEVTRALRVP